ncbi:MAG: DNA helicase RecQ [Coriobacteriales bacterium]|jgi:ATP-dependent DNA helicase RecQ
MEPREALATYFGYDEFRPGQAEVVDALMAGRDVLTVMPTGAGKSVCYQVPALCLGGLTLVISPLISLMKDQVSALERSGANAALLNSSLPAGERRAVTERIAGGEEMLVYIAPERLDDPGFLEAVAANPPRLVAIDEAHCVSQWGQDFRPSYTRIRGFIEGLPARPRVGAFTATATQAVRDDILALLGLRDPFVLVASFDRPNLHFEVRAPRDKDAELLAICRERRDRSGIVYCSSRRAVEEVCEMLCDAGFGATRYHAGLTAGERRENQDDFVFDRKPIIVATNAFGMGIDKSNVSFVVHYNLPLDLESYYQEAGRAGRDGEPADCILLYAKRDVQTCRFLIEQGSGGGEDVDPATRAMLLERAHERLRQMTFYATTTECLRGFILGYFGESAPGYCGSCGNCETQFEEVDATEEARKIISCVFRLRERGRALGKKMVVDILRGSEAERIKRDRFDTLSTYGIMKEVSANRAHFIVETLVEDGVLGMSGGQYPVLEFTEESLRFLREDERLVIKVPKERKPLPKEPKARAGKGRGAASDGPFDDALFERLRALRLEIAREEEVAAFIVFSNATLADMCRKMPTTLGEFLEVSGVGAMKAERYGERFVAEVNAYLDER